MNFSQKLQLLRKNKGCTQDELAGKLDVSRQAVAKWESGQVYPDISNLIQISRLCWNQVVCKGMAGNKRILLVIFLA
ncbi:helix-turn-helix domain-containing protein [Kineothrix sp. MSJ-39]|uniref:helix-turn-helix domain-containing protein n=1 Tax=Kineothrix sp. MSJ-39 TaxID=2841533 RepID=UPI001C10F830|nr:helix-turn-helix transcriptional regulator [Kineothrix sp. MSJ-39]MBU5431038.1 helix-turn-helix domain-containing protein [Kineothrix sp. MSJ-39]